MIGQYSTLPIFFISPISTELSLLLSVQCVFTVLLRNHIVILRRSSSVIQNLHSFKRDPSLDYGLCQWIYFNNRYCRGQKKSWKSNNGLCDIYHEKSRIGEKWNEYYKKKWKKQTIEIKKSRELNVMPGEKIFAVRKCREIRAKFCATFYSHDFLWSQQYLKL